MGGTYCFLCLIYLFLVSTFVRLGITDNFEYMIKLKDDLFRNYSVGLVPIRNQSNQVIVTMGMYIIMIQGLNMKNQVLTTSGWLKLAWRDEFLQWNPQDYGNITEIIIFQSDVWLPDVFLENTAVDRRELGNQHMLISVLSTGMVHWEPGIITDTSCSVDITRYPFDSQTCAVRFLTWMHTNKTMQVFPESGSINLEALLPNGEWDIISTRAEIYRYPSTYRLGTDHTGVTFVLELYRKRFFYILNTMIPVMLLSTLNVLVFILPSDCGERMALAVTVLLAFTVYLSIISENIPKTSEDTSILTIYLTLLLALSTASVVCAGIVLNIHFRDPHHPVPQCFISIFSRFCVHNPVDIWSDPGRGSWISGTERRSSLWNRRITRLEQFERGQSQHENELYSEQSKPLVRSPSLSPGLRPRRHSQPHLHDDGIAREVSMPKVPSSTAEHQDKEDHEDLAAQDSPGRTNDTDGVQHVSTPVDTDAREQTAQLNDTSAGLNGVRTKDKDSRLSLPNDLHLRQVKVLANNTVAVDGGGGSGDGDGGGRGRSSSGGGGRRSRKKAPRPVSDFNRQFSVDKETTTATTAATATTATTTTTTTTTTSPKLEARFFDNPDDRPAQKPLFSSRSSTRKPSSNKAVVTTFTTELQKLFDEKKQQQEQSQITWHHIGNTLDRVLFWVFFFVTGSVNITIILLLSS